MSEQRVYVALGDSMSIDDYTAVPGGGAVSQFHRWLGNEWRLIDGTYDGCRMSGVPTNHRGQLITLTIGGNDLLWNREIHAAFLGHENEYLCLGIEPTLKGAHAISRLFREVYERHL